MLEKKAEYLIFSPVFAFSSQKLNETSFIPDIAEINKWDVSHIFRQVLHTVVEIRNIKPLGSHRFSLETLVIISTQ